MQKYQRSFDCGGLMDNSLEQFPEIMRKKETRAEVAEQGEGHGRADARKGRQRGYAVSVPAELFSVFWGTALDEVVNKSVI